VVEARLPLIDWRRPIVGARAAVLLGAFDPPTNAHLAVVRVAAQRTGAPGVLCTTSVLLARPADRLLGDDERLQMLLTIAESEDLGLCIANGGTYLEVARQFRNEGIKATFVIGADKVAQLSDVSFYADGRAGVDATFREVSFLVVERGGPTAGLPVIRAHEAFTDASDAAISATEVRRRVRAGLSVKALVPPVVAEALEGYTAGE
jgi:nicotinic acid mononucleotide adenylyltransferase